VDVRTLRGSYRSLVKALRRQDPGTAMELAVGGEFRAIGVLERQLLIQYGLAPTGCLVDVGCGSGRLALPLSQYLKGRYLGTDVVPELLDHARRAVNRPDWRFELVKSITIPERDGQADMVCFFSVITHLLHEQSYTYLREAARVLKPGGRIVISFLEFRISTHWSVFETDVTRGDDADRPLNMFVSREALETWASHLSLGVVAFHDGDKPHIVLSEPVTMSSGEVQSGLGTIGQSVCVLAKPE
jgi:SAM-dependent methyltransferase